MPSEELQLLRNTADSFAQQAISPRVNEIEEGGIPDDLLGQLRAQGFYAALIPQEAGGSGLDMQSYLALLHSISRVSPTVGATMLYVNSVLGNALKKRVELLSGIVQGSVKVSASPSIFYGTSDLSGPGGVLQVSNVLCPGGDYVILNDGGSLRLLSGRFTWEHRKALGMRSIGLASLRAEAFRTEDLGTSAQEVIEATDLPVAAVSLGITEGAVQKAMDYSRVRTTFNVPLKDYEPVAQPLARIVATKDILLQALMSADNPREALAVKVNALELMKEAVRVALQVHGGYGYFRDFGVEKFYRDSAALTAMFSDTRNDMRRLASEVYGERAGFI